MENFVIKQHNATCDDLSFHIKLNLLSIFKSKDRFVIDAVFCACYSVIKFDNPHFLLDNNYYVCCYSFVNFFLCNFLFLQWIDTHKRFLLLFRKNNLTVNETLLLILFPIALLIHRSKFITILTINMILTRTTKIFINLKHTNNKLICS